MPNLEDTDPARQRAVALYTFLKEFIQLRSKTVRSVDQYEEVLWFSDLPREPGCDCAAWHRGEGGEDEEVWLTIRQPRIVAAPSPPLALEPWIVREQIADSSIEIPELLEEASILVKDESGQQRFERRVIADWPVLLFGYRHRW